MEGDSFEGNAAFPVPGGGLISRLWVGGRVSAENRLLLPLYSISVDF